MQAVHEAPFLVALHPGVLGIVVEDPGDQRRGPSDDPGRHRDRIVGVDVAGLAGDLLADDAVRLSECERRFLATDHGLPVDDHGVALRLVVSDPDPLLDEGVVAVHQLLDFGLAAVEIADELGTLPADAGAPFCREVAVELLLGPHAGLADAGFQVGEQRGAGGGIEVRVEADAVLGLLELAAGPLGIGGEQLPGIADPHGRLPLQLLATHAAHRLELGELAVALGRIERRRRRRGRVPCPLLGDGADDPRNAIVGVAPQGCLGKADCRGMGAGGLGLPRQQGQRRRLADHGAARERQAFAAEDRQEDAVSFPRIAGELAEEGVVRRDDRSRKCQLDGLSGAVRIDRERQRRILDRPLDEQDGFAVGTQGGQP